MIEKETPKILWLDPEDIEDVRIKWNESGYKRIAVTLKNGEINTLESDS